VQAFERLSIESRYFRFMQNRKRLDDAILQRGVHPRPGSISRSWRRFPRLTASISLEPRSMCAQTK
jgi:hypothetical protein